MDYKGYCLWASDIPSQKSPHYIVIASGKNHKNEFLVVAISSIKYYVDGSTRFFDPSCVLNIDDIKDENGNNVLTKPSFIRYQYSCSMTDKELLHKQVCCGYSFKCRLSDDLLRRIQEGARCSKELPECFKSFFEYF